jgi:tryptophan synthase alpha chain
VKTGALAPSRIGGVLARARQERRTALIPFITAGYPSLAQSEELVLALVRGGADIVEIGVPFSDPLADGATVQRTSQVALDNGVRVADALALAGRLRSRGVDVPLVFMGYYNPFLQYGIERFATDAAAAGVDGAIVPDLPAEESDDLLAAFRRHGRDLIFMLAPTSTDERIDEVAQRASGFVYCVSLTGVTGGRRELPDVTGYLRRVRSRVDLPLVVGFGISSPEHVRQVGQVADAVAVGSALIDAIDRAPDERQPDVAEAFLRHLASGADKSDA